MQCKRYLAQLWNDPAARVFLAWFVQVMALERLGHAASLVGAAFPWDSEAGNAMQPSHQEAS